MDIKKALEELRKEKERKFDQSVDLVVNLRAVDLKRDQINLVLTTPNKVKEKRVCAFLNEKSKVIDTITPVEFSKYKDKKALKSLVDGYDFFIANAPLMPKVATAFGKVLGPAGKMPSPQLGIILKEDDASVKEVVDKIGKAIKMRVKEASIKLPIGKLSMSDSEIEENFKPVYKAIVNALPKKNENVKNVMVKLTMSKPIRLEVK
tara:strand:+ start:5671 stop:6288 length:618 start_codon:yes stop_codon:yes gene_type:complete